MPENPESTAIEVEDIPALLRDVARFAEAVEKLKDVVLAEGKCNGVLYFINLWPCLKSLTAQYLASRLLSLPAVVLFIRYVE